MAHLIQPKQIATNAEKSKTSYDQISEANSLKRTWKENELLYLSETMTLDDPCVYGRQAAFRYDGPVPWPDVGGEPEGVIASPVKARRSRGTWTTLISAPDTLNYLNIPSYITLIHTHLT